jgi:hypothetical protein
MIYDENTIRDDIKRMNAKEFYIKYIIKTNNWYFAEYQHTEGDALIDKMDRFKEIVSNCFEVSFHSAQIVGSAKLGISLSPNKPFRHFVEKAGDSNQKESDIDVAIVSSGLFGEIWDKIREERKKSVIPKYLAISKSIFRGYINDKDFKDLDGLRKGWEEKISKCNILLQGDLSIIHPISYRIYRNWEDLEDYQIDSIIKTKEVLLQDEV